MAKSRFEELGWRSTPMGEISLRRRWDPTARTDVHEIKLDDEYLMSSLFTEAEEEMARLALAELRAASAAAGTDGDTDADADAGGSFDVAVGGLGLGYTALTVLQDPGVRSLVVVEALGEVVDWHEEGLIPAGTTLTADPRCRLERGDFFARAGDPGGLVPDEPGRVFDAVVVDIDHSPRHLLNPSHAPFYTTEGTRRLAGLLRPGGVFALWSNDPPDQDYLDVLGGVLDGARAEVVTFPNPYQDRPATNTVYLATRAGG